MLASDSAMTSRAREPVSAIASRGKIPSRRSRMLERLAGHRENLVKSIPLVELAAQRRSLGRRIDDAILRVCEHANFIMGDEVKAFERQLAEFCGARHALTC